MAANSISPPMTRSLKLAELGKLIGPSNNSSIRALLKRDLIEAERPVGTYRGHLVLRWRITALGRKDLKQSEWLHSPWFRREFGNL